MGILILYILAWVDSFFWSTFPVVFTTLLKHWWYHVGTFPGTFVFSFWLIKFSTSHFLGFCEPLLSSTNSKCNHTIYSDSETLSNIITPLHLLCSGLPAIIQVSSIFSVGAYTVSCQRSLLIRRCSSVALHSWKVLGVSRVGESWKSLPLKALLLYHSARAAGIPAPHSPASVPQCQGTSQHRPSGVELHYQPEHITSFELLQYIKWWTRFYFIQEHPHERSFKSFQQLWNLCIKHLLGQNYWWGRSLLQLEYPFSS